MEATVLPVVRVQRHDSGGFYDKGHFTCLGRFCQWKGEGVTSIAAQRHVKDHHQGYKLKMVGPDGQPLRVGRPRKWTDEQKRERDKMRMVGQRRRLKVKYTCLSVVVFPFPPKVLRSWCLSCYTGPTTTFHDGGGR